MNERAGWLARSCVDRDAYPTSSDDCRPLGTAAGSSTAARQAFQVAPCEAASCGALPGISWRQRGALHSLAIRRVNSSARKSRAKPRRSRRVSAQLVCLVLHGSS